MKRVKPNTARSKMLPAFSLACVFTLGISLLWTSSSHASTWMQEALKPKNVKPPDPEAKNPRMPTERPSGEPKPACNGLNSKECTHQASAYTEAASAASYLGLYFRTNSFFGVVHDSKDFKKNEIHKLIELCILGKSNCDDYQKKQLATAKMQYNIGKYIRNMMLQSNTFRENLRSAIALDPNAKEDQKSLTKEGRFPGDEKGKTVADKTIGDSFKLGDRFKKAADIVEYNFYRDDSEEVIDNDTHETRKVEKRFVMKRTFLPQKEADILGNDFIHQYGIFIDTIANSGIDEKSNAPRWKEGFIKLDAHTAGKNDIQQFSQSFDAQKGKAPSVNYETDELAYQNVHREHNADAVNEGTKLIKKEWVEIGTKKSFKQLHENDFNIAKFDPEKNYSPFQRAKAMAKKIDEQVARIEKDESARRGEPVKYVQINVGDFDKFLDSIWPPSEEKRHSLMAQYAENQKNPPAELAQKPAEKKKVEEAPAREPSALQEQDEDDQ